VEELIVALSPPIRFGGRRQCYRLSIGTDVEGSAGWVGQIKCQ
jgi:hypothetical protein